MLAETDQGRGMLGVRWGVGARRGGGLLSIVSIIVVQCRGNIGEISD